MIYYSTDTVILHLSPVRVFADTPRCPDLVAVRFSVPADGAVAGLGAAGESADAVGRGTGSGAPSGAAVQRLTYTPARAPKSSR